MRADLQQFYGINIDDVWSGTVPVRHVVILSHQLRVNPYARIHGLDAGEPGLTGWDTHTRIAAATYNLLLSVNSKKDSDISDLLIMPPGSEEVKEHEIRVPTIAEFTQGVVDKFMNG